MAANTPLTLERLLGSPEPMLQAIDSALKAAQLPRNLLCDHICFRVEHDGAYQQFKKSLERVAVLEGEHHIAGRPICTFRLLTPYQSATAGLIEAVELPAPKKGSPYALGWQHAEFVTDDSLDSFMRRYPHIDFNTQAMGKSHNPEISMDITGPKGEAYAIKFHQEPLLTVVAREKLGM
jgi:predicted metalloenzyme YecM